MSAPARLPARENFRSSLSSRRSPMGRLVGEGGFFRLRASITLLICGAAASSIVTGIPTTSGLAFFRSEAPANSSQRILTFAERVTYQRAIEEVYWRHRIWPKERADSKPSLDAVMSQEQLETKVADYLGNSQALEDYWQRPITPEQLQAEMERIASHTKQPGVLRELFAALGNDPFVIAECLARPVLAERLITELNNEDRVKLTTIALRKQPLQSWLAKAEAQMPVTMVAESASYALPVISGQSDNWTPSVVCTDDTWTSTSLTNAPAGRYYYTAAWTGSEMIVWGGYDRTSYFNTGGRYNPSTDSWVATSTIGAPGAREAHTAVWTGTEMIVWGGTAGQPTFFNTGGRYNPSTDSWTATSTTNAPDGRNSHTAVWTGSEMIVWGGYNGNIGWFNTGGRYNPSTDSWTATSTTNAPAARFLHTGLWTGSEMIVWGGADSSNYLNTGGRYNLSTDSWTATTTTNAPDGRAYHTAVLTGSQMIVWGGWIGSSDVDTGGRYNPSTDSWTATSTTNAPDARYSHAAAWTGSEMIVWGGWTLSSSGLNTGGRYNSNTDSWTATSTTNAPAGRFDHTAIWTGSEMIVWGGRYYSGGYHVLNTGGRYCAAAPGATPTPTPTATVTATATPTSTSSPTARPTPDPRVRPTPAPRP
jgi:N-acetylneuraminic acid mutarotase